VALSATCLPKFQEGGKSSMVFAGMLAAAGENVTQIDPKLKPVHFCGAARTLQACLTAKWCHSGDWGAMVPAEGFEPPTFGLQNRCTTTVLSRLERRVFPGAVEKRACASLA
jgi:hypothetical protein